ncbi:hypothetical protein PC9H_006559 [Pleurotus ostreatus]|uniref:Uncharacterized protein n=2 Tax=Pleurotus ostreatus TaxID=5322 RepID=A0A067NST6_PLEO1|nr:uncharacterized protein PC9H_006559 [Pleurotus ostreatus]KAF7430845.1 hypothetical protein PC9H_006559 [Pleurotus ostreatus]KAJ8695207.1 hypothetical protein PTI98_007822 [Pleurotus ostreatus]KDQ26681.1 hypothetical protein PLEOSDRAFT_1113170 [Pleurotus ostreatus PC15]
MAPRVHYTSSAARQYGSSDKLKSCTAHAFSIRSIERQVVRAWKHVTHAARHRQNRISTLPCDFVYVTDRRRSAIIYTPSMPHVN